MKIFSIYSVLGLALFLHSNECVEAIRIRSEESKLDEATKQSVKMAAAAALKVAVAAKKAESAASIKSDMQEVKKAEVSEASDAITEAVER